jgi:hypothetical protein
MMKSKKSKKASKKFENQFTEMQLTGLLSGLTPYRAYSFTKRDDAAKFGQVLNLLPPGYQTGLSTKLESVDLVFSGSTTSQFLLTIAVGRSDHFQNAECFDIDVFNIAPENGSADSYFLNQWYHFKDNDGNRISHEIIPYRIADESNRKDVLYNVYLTGSTNYYSFDNYKEEKPDFYDLHVKSFGDLNKK